MSKKKYLVLLRRTPNTETSGAAPERPSPEAMQKMFAAYNAWREQFKDDIVDIGDKLTAGGRLVTASGVADGPFVETKEVIGGFMIISATSYDGAVELVQACPATQMPGAKMEIREMAGASM